MSLNLDARQRAMLQEMGISLWLPAAAPLAQPEASVATASAPEMAHSPAPAPVPAPGPAPTPAPVQAPPQDPDAAPIQAPSRARVAPAKAPPVQPDASAEAPAAVWQMAPLVQLYAPSGAPAAEASTDAWLVLLESPSPLSPLAGDVGRLLDNMLRALRLDQHPQVWVAGLQRPGSEALPRAGSMEPVDWQPLAPTLQAAMAQVQPARVLVLGQAVARAVLHRNEPLGQLRAQVHSVQGVPAVVTYDPAYLLRAAHAKPGAWADLCLAAAQPAAA